MNTLRLAARTLLRKPGFAIIAVATLAFGIGANTAIFTVADALLLRALPYTDPARLVVVWEAGPHDFGDEVGTSILDYNDWRAATRQLSSLAAYGTSGFNIESGDGAEYVDGQVVSANFFETLGVRLAHGRGFQLDEEDAGAPRVVVLSDGLWRRRFGGDPATVGKTILLSGEPYTVVGITPPRWRTPQRAELWVPLSFYIGNWRQWRATHQLTLIGRLAPGATAASAQAELLPIARKIWHDAGLQAFDGWHLRVVSLADQLHGDYRRTIAALWIAVALLLLITCANLANLLLVRAVTRTRELATRAALGATRARLIGEVLAESLLLAAAGAIAGIASGLAALRMFRALLPQELSHFIETNISVATIVYGCAIALVSALLFSAIPAWKVARTNMFLTSARTIGGRHRAGFAFVAVQVALAVPLLAGCLLMVRTMRNYARVDAGVRAESVLTFRIAPSPANYREPASRPELYRRIAERLRAMPGVELAGMSSNIPFSRVGPQTSTSIFVEGRSQDQRGAGDVRAADPGLLRALGMRLIRGRWIDERDATGPRVAVINETMARRLWPNGDPIGARIIDGNETIDFDSPNRWFTIVGIVADAKSGGLRSEPVPEVYLPFAKRPTRTMMFVIRGADSSVLASAARDAVRGVDPRQAVFDVAELTTLVDESITSARLAFFLFSAMGAGALLLAMIGTYAVVAYSVGSRKQELGIRATLGATPRVLWRMILGDGLRVAIIGLAVGLLLARGSGRALSSVLYGVAPTDTSIAAATMLTLLFAVLAATFVPALAALRVSPADALRQE